MLQKVLIMSLLSMLMLAGCTTTSHVMIGKPRMAIPVEEVIYYPSAPANYEKIAVLSASSKLSWTMTDQGKIEKVIERMKEEAASLGANGILIKRTDDEYSGQVSTGTGTSNDDFTNGAGVVLPVVNKSALGLAIYVPVNGEEAVSSDTQSATAESANDEKH